MVIRVPFAKAIGDFNEGIVATDSDALPLIAEFSNGFTMVWIGYALYCVPVICALMGIRDTADLLPAVTTVSSTYATSYPSQVPRKMRAGQMRPEIPTYNQMWQSGQVGPYTNHLV